MASPSKGAASTTPPVTPVQSPAHRATGCDEKLKNPFQVLAGAPEEEESQHDGTETPSLDHSPHDPAHRAAPETVALQLELHQTLGRLQGVAGAQASRGATWRLSLYTSTVYTICYMQCTLYQDHVVYIEYANSIAQRSADLCRQASTHNA